MTGAVALGTSGCGGTRQAELERPAPRHASETQAIGSPRDAGGEGPVAAPDGQPGQPPTALPRGPRRPPESYAPRTVEGLAGAVEVAAGGGHTCARLESGEVRCWGANRLGQLGAGRRGECSFEPVEVSGLGDAVELAAGGVHTCARLGSGEVRCWGGNSYGQVGDESREDRASPFPVPGLTGVSAIATSLGQSCAVTEGGDALCWGSGADGMIAETPEGDERGARPARLALPFRVAQIDLGSSHVCALSKSRSVFCWGDNGLSQAGRPSLRVELVERAARVRPLRRPLELTVGTNHGCVRLASGVVSCWGSNLLGQLARSIDVSTSPRPAPVPGLRGATQVSSLEDCSCARTREGRVLCWGPPSLLGVDPDSEEDLDPAPREVPGLADAVQVSAGWRHACALRRTGQVVCWGENDYGQLGRPEGVSCPARDPMPSPPFGAREGDMGPGGRLILE